MLSPSEAILLSPGLFLCTERGTLRCRRLSLRWTGTRSCWNRPAIHLPAAGRPPWHQLGGRARGWHADSSLSRQSVEQASLLDFPWQLCSLRVCATSPRPAEPGELTWAGARRCSQRTKRLLAWAVQPQQRSPSLPLSPARSRAYGWNANGWRVQVQKAVPASCCCKDIVASQIKFPLYSLRSPFFSFFSPA